jgi:hypothetical protein
MVVAMIVEVAKIVFMGLGVRFVCQIIFCYQIKHVLNKIKTNKMAQTQINHNYAIFQLVRFVRI